LKSLPSIVPLVSQSSLEAQNESTSNRRNLTEEEEVSAISARPPQNPGEDRPNKKSKKRLAATPIEVVVSHTIVVDNP